MQDKVLITGGAGFIGQELTKQLLGNGYGVVVLDDLSNAVEPPHPGRQFDYTFIKGDVAETAVVTQAIQGCHHVVHLAALSSVPQSLNEPARTFRSNVQGTEVVLQAAQAARAAGQFPGWVVLASSAAVYGIPTHTNPLQETDSFGVALPSPYAASKAVNELQANGYKTAFGLPVVALRLFNVYGAGQPATNPYAGFLAKAVQSVKEGTLLTIYGDGLQTRDFVAVQDVALAMRMLLQQPLAYAATLPLALNVGTGTAVTLLDTIRQVVAITRVNPRVEYRGARAGDVRSSCATVAALRQVLPGWQPRSLADGLRLWLAPAAPTA
ncbi:MAG: NAD-dependent epimerase/dehydratase family protein [Alphaproteobacteria bacterium]|nr:NAD-dependent epimerase/dehydratase family protein [Alphaproteobacteria bacterium]